MSGSPVLRAMTEDDVQDVLRLNADHVELLAPLDATRLEALRGWASRADVITHDGRTAGFVLVFEAGTAYDSENYRWFSQRYTEFHYLDRIVVDPRFRRLGLASAVYDEVERGAASAGRLLLEVNVEPPNHPSLAFHQGRGFVEVGRQGPPGHRVVLLAKEVSAEGRTRE
jgi:predicted GNAT superfamily acetyltransferase